MHLNECSKRFCLYNFYVSRHEHANEIHSKRKAAMFRIHVGVRGEWKIKKAIFAPSYKFHNCMVTWKSERVDKQPVCVCFKAFSFMYLYVFTLVCVTLIKISHLSFGFRSLTCCCTFATLHNLGVKFILWDFKSLLIKLNLKALIFRIEQFHEKLSVTLSTSRYLRGWTI